VKPLQTPSPPAIDRALSVLEEVARSRGGMRLSELAQCLGVARSSAHAVALALERRGYLERNQTTGRYLLGSNVFAMANEALGGAMMRTVAFPHLVKLMRQTHLMVHMAILERDQAVLIDQVAPPRIDPPLTWPGKRLELHCTALGKALAAFEPREEWDRFVAEHTLARHNDNTICTPKRFLEELARVRERGYALDDEEVDLGVRCISSPVLSPRGNAAAAISVSGTTSEIRRDNTGELAAALISAATAIAEGLEPRSATA
jgi:DNA-binding IclR family transcriptional regulator